MANIDQKLNLHFETMPAPTKKAFDWLSKQKWLGKSKWYLAGGTALALSAGHRSSVDLDFFTPRADFNLGGLTKKLSAAGDWKEFIAKEGTLYGKLFGVKMSFIAYPFFIPRDEKIKYGNVSILLPEDIAVMKIIAVSRRGRKRDFYDLYWYVKNREPLSDIILRVPKQYQNLEHNYHHIIKSLSYFVDAEDDPMPKLFFKANWNEVKKFFHREVKVLANKFKIV